MQWYTVCMSILLLLGIVVFIILNVRKLESFREHLLPNAVEMFSYQMLSIMYQ